MLNAGAPKWPTWKKWAVAIGLLWVAGIVMQALGIVDEGDSGSRVISEDTEDRYVEYIRDHIAGTATKSDAEIVRAGKGLCAALAGKSKEEVLRLAATLGYNVDEFAAALVGSVRSFCPEYEYLIE